MRPRTACKSRTPSRPRSSEFGDYVEGLSPHTLLGRFGVQVVGWDVDTREPVYAKTSQILVGEVSGPDGITDFAVESVTQDI